MKGSILLPGALSSTTLAALVPALLGGALVSFDSPVEFPPQPEIASANVVMTTRIRNLVFFISSLPPVFFYFS